MSESWTTKAQSKNSTHLELSEQTLNEEAVILLQGVNTFGDRVFSYLKLTVRNYLKLKDALKNGDKFFPSEFGTVLAAGKGEPSQELRSEMAVTHKLVDIPRKAEKPATPKMGSFAAKNIGNLWGDDK